MTAVGNLKLHFMRRWEVRVWGRLCLCTLIRLVLRFPLTVIKFRRTFQYPNIWVHKKCCVWNKYESKAYFFLYHDYYYYKLCYGLFSLQFIFFKFFKFIPVEGKHDCNRLFPTLINAFVVSSKTIQFWLTTTHTENA